MDIVSCQNVTYTHQGRCIIQNLNFSVKRGECIVLTGTNGTGKTTTLNLLAGLIRPSSGRILVNGLNIHHFPLPTKKLLGFLPDKAPLYHELTVSEYLNLVAKLRQIPVSEHAARINKTLADLNLKPQQHRIIGTLSKGQQQRVGIAQAILHHPILLLLDEPTHGLDPDQIESLVYLLCQYKKQAAIILSTHHFNEMESLCNKRFQLTEQGIKQYEYDLNDCPA